MGGEKKRGEGEGEYCEEVGLGLRMQSRESFPNNNNNKRMIAMPHLPACSNTSTTTTLYHHFNYKINNNINSSNNYSYISSPYCETMSNITSTSSTVSAAAATVDGVSGGSLYCNLSNNNNNNKVDYWSDLYDVVSGAATSVVSGGGAVSLPRTFLPFTNSSDSSHRSSGGGMGGKSNKEDGSGFTVRQWEELERQIVICKYMMASIPVPPHLLLTLSNSISTNSLSNQNTTSCRLDLRYTRGGGNNNDAEPWRCRRTDGKKWRCSRDVLPYQKYCERHAHKPRPRSRKPVEPQNCHITKNITSTNSTTINNSTSPATITTTTQALQRQVFNIIPATIISGANYVQPRSTEWFMKGDLILGSSLNEQWQQHLGQPSPRQGLKLYDEHERDVSVFQENYVKEHELDIHTNTFLCSNDDSSFHNRLDSDHQAQTTRHFIDAWSCADRELEIGHVSNQTPSLTLSISGTENDWLDANTYTCLPPGGPLGEALCLGICSTTTKGQSNLASPHEGYSNSTTNSTCSKSSCEDNSHGLNFR